MKATTWIFVAIFAILAVIFGMMWIGSANKSKELARSNDELTKLYENSTVTLNEIQGSLEEMDKDLTGQLLTKEEKPGSTPEDRRARVVSSIANMRSQIEADKKRIADLERQLAKSKGQLSSIQSMISKLKSSVTDKEKIVNELEGRLGDLSKTLASERQLSQAEINRREAQIKEKQSLIEQQSTDMNRMYFVFGTRKELMDRSIIDRKGGLLGIGKVSTVHTGLISEKFTEFNLLDNQTISFPSTKKGYAILSNHVAASYRVEKVDGQNVLTVIDPEMFRKQKFVVIELL
ncbi:MAG: hypothetical protein Q8M98_06080 [Candidatus Cloacimonadaceae bacterium]|nr:hypothetical protein [Candidatus Cloacimonadaceae bacterium]MDP3114330.1 hypothetical protein [Candidatus Cloacimonadaceae bacterium]